MTDFQIWSHITMSAQTLMNEIWKPIVTAKLLKNSIPGIYLIGVNFHNLFVVPLYLGRSKDIRRRLNEHMQPSQKGKMKIDNFIQNQTKDSIMVKWICDVDQKTTEGVYLNYVEKYYGFKLIFNMKAGDGEKKSTGMLRGSYFRPRASTRACIRPFPSRQRRVKAGKTVSLRDVQLARQIRGKFNNNDIL